jgi:hypothetical protein
MDLFPSSDGRNSYYREVCRERKCSWHCYDLYWRAAIGSTDKQMRAASAQMTNCCLKSVLVAACVNSF